MELAHLSPRPLSPLAALPGLEGQPGGSAPNPLTTAGAVVCRKRFLELLRWRPLPSQQRPNSPPDWPPLGLGPTLAPCCPLQCATPLPTACKPPAPQGAPPPQMLGLTPTHPSDHGPNTMVACPCRAVPTALPVPDLSPGGSAGAPWREPPQTLLVLEPTFSPSRDRLVDEACPEHQP